MTTRPRGTVRVSRKGRTAYLLPANPEPATDIVVAVHIPDDPAFLQAFWGSLDYLASPWAWANDAAHNAYLAAQRMALATRETHITWEVLGDLQTLRINIDTATPGDAANLPGNMPAATAAVAIHF